MRCFAPIIIAVVSLSACGPAAPAATTAATAAPAASPATAPAPTVAPATKAVQPTVAAAANAAVAAIDGIRLTVDGKTVDLPGEVKVTKQSAGATSVLHIGKNASPSALVGGNGVLLELQTLPGKDEFSAATVGVATFTVWKGVDFSYMSTGAIPGKPMESLVLSQSGGKLTGSYETNLSGMLGKLKAKIEFGVSLPK